MLQVEYIASLRVSIKACANQEPRRPMNGLFWADRLATNIDSDKVCRDYSYIVVTTIAYRPSC